MNTDQNRSGYFQTHRIAARIENARWLLATGLPIGEVAKRLGVSVTCIEKDLAR